MTRYTIEPNRLGGYTAYEWGVYERGSSLAGQRKKSSRDAFDSVAQALEAYPKAEVSAGRIPAGNYVGHLPGDDDLGDMEQYERKMLQRDAELDHEEEEKWQNRIAEAEAETWRLANDI
jgi:hypothetical protein